MERVAVRLPDVDLCLGRSVRVPQPDGLVVIARRGEEAAVRRPGQPEHPARVRLQLGAGFEAGSGRPQDLEPARRVAERQARAVGTPRDDQDLCLAPGGGDAQRASRGGPQPDRPVPACRGQERAIGRPAHVADGFGVPLERRPGRPVWLPQADDMTIVAEGTRPDRGQAAAVRRPHHRSDLPGMSLQDRGLTRVSRRPQPHRPVVTARRQQRAIGQPCRRVDLAQWSGALGAPRGRRIPQHDRVIEAARGQHRAVGRPCELRHPVHVARQQPSCRPVPIPQAHRAVGTPGRQDVAVRRPGEGIDLLRVPHDVPFHGPRPSVPHANRLRRPEREQRPVRRPGERPSLPVLQGGADPPPVAIPDPNHAVPTGRREVGAVGRPQDDQHAIHAILERGHR